MHLKIKHCKCGRPIFSTIPEIIFENGLSTLLGRSAYKLRKGVSGMHNRSLLDLCIDCREKYDKKWRTDYYKNNRNSPAGEPSPTTATIT